MAKRFQDKVRRISLSHQNKVITIVPNMLIINSKDIYNKRRNLLVVY